MHELSLALDLLGAVERNLAGGVGSAVRIRVSVGAASGVVPAALEFAFRAAVSATPMEGVELALHVVPASSRCFDCGRVFEFTGIIGACPECGRLGGELLSGGELMLEAIEVADV